MNKCTIAICTTSKNMPTPREVCPHKWDNIRDVRPDSETCLACDIECYNHCGAKLACPCNMVEVIKPKKGQVFDLTEPGLYIELREVKYAKIGNAIRIGG